VESVEDWLNSLKESDKLIVVEGIKDKKVLEDFGIVNIITLNKPMYKLVEDIYETKKEVVILTDLDKEGEYLYKKLKSDLQRFGVKIDNKFREFLFRETKISNIESIRI